jgi:hypothetical protein
VEETAYSVDKHIWLIGSGNLYNRAVKFDTSRDMFFAYLKKSANEATAMHDGIASLFHGGPARHAATEQHR